MIADNDDRKENIDKNRSIDFLKSSRESMVNVGINDVIGGVFLLSRSNSAFTRSEYRAAKWNTKVIRTGAVFSTKNTVFYSR